MFIFCMYELFNKILKEMTKVKSPEMECKKRNSLNNPRWKVSTINFL